MAVSEEKQDEIVECLNHGNVHNILQMSGEIYWKLKMKVEQQDEIYRELKNKIEQQMAYFANKEIKQHLKDVLYGQNLDRVMQGSSWLQAKDFTTGGYAVNNQYLYILYRILDSGKFHSLLDLGLGITSKMMCQYAASHKGTSHTIIESDLEWIDFFMDVNGKMQSNIEFLDYEMCQWNGDEVRVFANLKKCLQGRKFDYISIDAPVGEGMKNYSRIDILEILPGCLMDSWIIMMDDVHRMGERNTLEKIQKILKDNGIPYVEAHHSGTEKEFAILASPDNRFFCTV